MLDGNGIHVYTEIRKIKPELPFIFLSDINPDELIKLTKNDNHVEVINKPFSSKSFLTEFSEFLNQNSLGQNETEKKYIDVSIKTLLKIEWIRCPLYIKINTQKYLKVFNANSQFEQKNFFHYHQKNINFLYVAENDFAPLVSEFKNKILTGSLFDSLDLSSVESFEYSFSVQEVMSTTMKTCSFTAQDRELAEKNIKIVKAILDKNMNLKSLLDGIQDNSDFGFAHSLIISILSSYITGRYTFKQSFATEYLSLAAFFHDVSLSPFQLKNEQRFTNSILLNLPVNKDEITFVMQHPEQSAQMLSQWDICPEPVLDIIRKHHERPDGKGYPNQLKAEDLDELSACFIVVEYFANKYVQKTNIDMDTKKINSDNLFSQKPFADFYQILASTLN